MRPGCRRRAATTFGSSAARSSARFWLIGCSSGAGRPRVARPPGSGVSGRPRPRTQEQQGGAKRARYRRQRPCGPSVEGPQLVADEVERHRDRDRDRLRRQLGHPERTKSSSTIRLTTRAATLTVKKRAAWKPAWPSPASKVQWRFQKKLLMTATTKAPIAGGDVVDVERPDQDREGDQVDDVARAADDPELDELGPVLGLAGAAADPPRGLDRAHPFWRWFRWRSQRRLRCADPEVLEDHRRLVAECPLLAALRALRPAAAEEQRAERVAAAAASRGCRRRRGWRRPSRRTRSRARARSARRRRGARSAPTRAGRSRRGTPRCRPAGGCGRRPSRSDLPRGSSGCRAGRAPPRCRAGSASRRRRARPPPRAHRGRRPRWRD